MPIHVAITRKVLPGKEQEFHEALRRFIGKSFENDAVHGAGIITFPHEKTNEIGILRTFANQEEREAFYNSAFFKEWDAYAATLTEGEAKYRDLTGLEAWFRTPGAPARWKMALVTLAGVYPVSLLLTYTVAKALEPLPLPLRSFIFSACMVAMLTWIVMPFLVKHLKPWLHRS